MPKMLIDHIIRYDNRNEDKNL